MEEKPTFEFCFPLIHNIAENPLVKYECTPNPQMIYYEIEVNINSVNNMILHDFLKELDKCIENGLEKLEASILNLNLDDGTNILNDILMKLQYYKNLVGKEEAKPGIDFYWFRKAKYDDGKNNKVYVDRMRTLQENEMNKDAKGEYVIRLTDTNIEKYDQLLLNKSCHFFALFFDNRLDSLKLKLEKLNTRLIAESVMPETKDNKYRLIIGSNYSAKEFVYLFNILYRIGFFVVGIHDHEKLFKLIADIYESGRGEHTKKVDNVRNCWKNSDNRINEKFLKNFKEEIIKRISVIVGEDCTIGYDSDRLLKK